MQSNLNPQVESEEDFAQWATKLLDEFLLAADVADAVQCVRDLGSDRWHADVASKVVAAALDTPKERDQGLLVSLVVALGAGKEPALARAVLDECMASQLGMLEDLAIDIPYAPKVEGDRVEGGRGGAAILGHPRTPCLGGRLLTFLASFDANPPPK